MDTKNIFELVEKYYKCPECGNVKVERGDGGLIIMNNEFRRVCKCGFYMRLKSNGESIDTIRFSIEYKIEDLKMLRDFMGALTTENLNDVIKKNKLYMDTDKVEANLMRLYGRVIDILETNEHE